VEAPAAEAPDDSPAEPPIEPPAEPAAGDGGTAGPDRRIWWIGGAAAAAVVVIIAVIASLASSGGSKAVKFAPDGWVYEKLTATGATTSAGMSDTAKALARRLEAAGVKGPKYRSTADAVYLAVPPASKAALTHLDLNPPLVAVEEVVRSMPLANATAATCQPVLPNTNAVTTGQCLIVAAPSLVSADIDGATIAKVDHGYTVTMSYTDAGIGKLIGLSQGTIGRQVAYVVDGAVLSAPVVPAPITGPTVVATVPAKADADRIASTIDAAAHLVKLRRGTPQDKPIK
jgi:preprotein translocase subunit SecD